MATVTHTDVLKSRLPWPQSLPQRAVAILRGFEVNRAVFFSILAQVWSALAGLVTMLIIAHWLSAVEQGFYYTFSSVLALQIFVELGLVTVIVQVASHEWAFLKKDSDGQISGNPQALSRLASLLRFALRWYAVSGLLVIIGLSVAGYIFFSAKSHPGIVWQRPWLALCGIAGFALMMSPLFSVIEGCNQVASIYSFRFVQGVLNSLALIACILLGMGLYALAAAALVRLTCGMVFIAWKHRPFVQQLLTCSIGERIQWRTELWPFQWRIGVSWISGYFIFSIFTPVMFYYRGPRVAGQMGMTLALVAAIESLAYAWINTRMPQFGMLVARQQFTELDRFFRRLLWIALAMAGAAGTGVWGLILCLHYGWPSLSERVLPLLAVTLFLVQRILNVAISAMAFYLRAHKREPLVIVSLVGAGLVGFCTWMFGAKWGPTGAASGFLLVTTLWSFPACLCIYRRCRVSWHQAAGAQPDPVRVAPLTS
jgi:O-antigen/teichoic acid export membrane protein